MTRALLAIAALTALMAATLGTAPRLAPTDSGVVDRSSRTDRTKAPMRVLRVSSECRSA